MKYLVHRSDSPNPDTNTRFPLSVIGMFDTIEEGLDYVKELTATEPSEVRHIYFVDKWETGEKRL